MTMETHLMTVSPSVQQRLKHKQRAVGEAIEELLRAGAELGV